MTSHMETETVNETETDNSFEKSEKLFLQGDTGLMGFKGRCRIWLEKEHGYIWSKNQDDDFAIDDLHRKIKLLNQRELGITTIDTEVSKFQLIIINLDDWVKEKKFSLKYLNEHFNEIKNGKSKSGPTQRNGKRDKIAEWYPQS